MDSTMEEVKFHRNIWIFNIFRSSVSTVSVTLIFFSASSPKGQKELPLCPELPWRNFTSPAQVTWILPLLVHLYQLHIYLWCPMSWCLIIKRPPLCILRQLPLSLFPSPTTPEENSGAAALDLIIAVFVNLKNALFDQNLFWRFWFGCSVIWTVAQDSPFTVSPSSCDLAPLKSTSLKVTYDPRQHNTLHGAQLECFAYYKVIFYDHIQLQHLKVQIQSSDEKSKYV